MDFDCPRLVWRPVCNPFDDGITACCGLRSANAPT